LVSIKNRICLLSLRYVVKSISYLNLKFIVAGLLATLKKSNIAKPTRPQHHKQETAKMQFFKSFCFYNTNILSTTNHIWKLAAQESIRIIGQICFFLSFLEYERFSLCSVQTSDWLACFVFVFIWSPWRKLNTRTINDLRWANILPSTFVQQSYVNLFPHSNVLWLKSLFGQAFWLSARRKPWLTTNCEFVTSR